MNGISLEFKRGKTEIPMWKKSLYDELADDITRKVFDHDEKPMSHEREISIDGRTWFKRELLSICPPSRDSKFAIVIGRICLKTFHKKSHATSHLKKLVRDMDRLGTVLHLLGIFPRVVHIRVPPIEIETENNVVDVEFERLH